MSFEEITFLKEYFSKNFTCYTQKAKTFESYSHNYLYYMGQARAYLEMFQEIDNLLLKIKKED